VAEPLGSQRVGGGGVEVAGGGRLAGRVRGHDDLAPPLSQPISGRVLVVVALETADHGLPQVPFKACFKCMYVRAMGAALCEACKPCFNQRQASLGRSKAPVSAGIAWRLANPLDNPGFAECGEFSLSDRTGHLNRRSDLAGAQSRTLSQNRHDRPRPVGKPGLQLAIYWLRVKRQLDAGRSLSIDRVAQASFSHLLEHAANSLTQFLAEVQVRADSRDSRVPGEPRGRQRIAEIDEARKAAWAPDLNPVIEDLHADVVSTKAVRPMYDCIDDRLEPYVLRDQRDVPESPLLQQRTPHRLQLLYGFAGPKQLSWDRAINQDVIHQLLPRPGTSVTSLVAENPHERLR
jgi:hypothetical protein